MCTVATSDASPSVERWLTGRYLKLVTAADRNLTTSSWHFVTEPALDLDMGSAMAAGVAGSPITADQGGASASFICLSAAARFALTSCAFAFLAAFQLAYSRNHLSFSAVHQLH
jgi:hypothetical protein